MTKYLLVVIKSINIVREVKSRHAFIPCFKNVTKFIGINPIIDALVKNGAFKNAAIIIAPSKKTMCIDI